MVPQHHADDEAGRYGHDTHVIKLVRSGRLEPRRLVTHRFGLADVMKAYDTFGSAAKERALKVILQSEPAGR